MKLPAGLGVSARHPTMADAGAIADLMNASDEADYGAAEMDAPLARDELARVDLPEDAWLVETDERGRRAAGLGWIVRRGESVGWDVTLSVHPAWRRKGIGTTLATALEQRARQHVREAPEGAAVAMRGWIKGEGPAERRWAEGLGWKVERRVLRMRIDLTASPPRAAWPAGIGVRSFVPGRDERPTFDALEEAFADHWGHLPAVFEDWVSRTRSDGFDPDLVLLATDGDEVVATSFGSVGPDGGWISGLGTRRAWRRRGIARAILLESFARFWERGVTAIALGVDGQSLTGATDLYESAGMRVVARYDQLGKVIRPGVDLATREVG